MNKKTISFDNFFNYGDTTPINRIAYSKADAEYKIEYIKAMLEMDDSIEVSIDSIGNICATLPARYHLVNSKAIVAGSHTDSVRDGGQYDGSLGVFMAMKTMEDLVQRKNSKDLELYADYKVVIFACEESTRFNMACIGSSYIANPDYVKDEDGNEYNYLDSLLAKKDTLKESDEEPNQGTLAEALLQFRQYIEEGIVKEDLNRTRIKFVDKVITPLEIDQLYEGHIEQSQQLIKEQILASEEYANDPEKVDFKRAPKKGSIDFKKLPPLVGRVLGIGKPVRGNIVVKSTSSTNPIITAAHLIVNNRQMALNSEKDSIRTSIPEFNSFDENDEYETLSSDENHTYYKIECFGESDHSGGTPMQDRCDSNVAMSELIIELQKLQEMDSNYKFEFLAAKTPIYGMNQIQDKTNLYISSSTPIDFSNKENNPAPIQAIIEKISQKHGTSFTSSIANDFTIPKSKHIIQLKNDMRQNGVATAKKTLETFNRDVVEKTLSEIGTTSSENPDLIKFTETSRGNPILTAKELLSDFVNICKKRNIICSDILSYPGHDCAVALPKEYNGKKVTGKRILIFIPSIFGSHNPQEQSWREAIGTGTSVFNDLIVSRFKILQRQAYNHMVSPRLHTSERNVPEFGSNKIITSKERKNRFEKGMYDGEIPELNDDEKDEIWNELLR